MTFVDDCSCSLEAVPDFFADFFCNRTDIVPLCIKLLQLTVSGNNVTFVRQFLDSFAKKGFLFQILLEIIIAELIVNLDDVVELFRVMLIFFPQFVGMFLRNKLDFLPSCLKVFELIINFVEVVLTCDKLLQLVDELKFQCIIGGFNFILFSCKFGALLFISG